MSAAILECCGVRWILSGTWSNALLEMPGVAPALAGARCGKCDQPLEVGRNGEQLCGEGLCFEHASHSCHVIGGPVLFFCKPHAEKMQAAAREAGIASRIAIHPPIPGGSALFASERQS